MKRNFFETIVLEPKEGGILSDDKFLEDLQKVADILVSGSGTIDAKFRKSIEIDHPDRLLLAAAWECIEDYDKFDVQGLTPNLLKLMLKHLNLIGMHFMYMDSQKVDFDGPLWTVDAFHVKEEDKALFQKQIDIGTGIVGACYSTKKIPPLPEVMPTDSEELRILEELMKRAEARVKAPTPNIWMSISTTVHGKLKMDEFREKVKSYVQEIRSGQYEHFISGKKNQGS